MSRSPSIFTFLLTSLMATGCGDDSSVDAEADVGPTADGAAPDTALASDGGPDVGSNDAGADASLDAGRIGTVEVSGRVSQGEVLVVRGGGFGERREAEPWVWDDFENGSEGALLETSPNVPWTRYSGGPGGDHPSYRSDGAYAGMLAAAKTGGYRSSDWSNYGVRGLDSDVMYVSMMFKWTLDEGNLDGGLIMKHTRLNSGDDFYRGRPSVWVTMRSRGTFYTNYNACDGEEGEQSRPEDEQRFTPGEWHRWEVVWKASTPGEDDGFVRYFLNHHELGPWFSPAMTRGASCPIGRPNNFLLPMMWDRGDDALMTFMVDNVYADRTMARVEIADTSTWEARTVSEVQPYVRWADDTLSIRVNQSNFVDGQSVYLYVVNEEGEVEREGIPLRIGAVYP